MQATFAVLSALALYMGVSECGVVMLDDDIFHNLTSVRVAAYVQQHERQTQANTKAMEDQLQHFKADFHSQLDVVDLQGAWLEERLQETSTRLNPLELFDEVHTYCVQQHRARLPPFAPFRTAATACLQKGTTAYAGIVGPPTTTLQNLKNYYISTHKKALADCKSLNALANRKYADCVMKAANVTMEVTQRNTHTFHRQMEAIACTARAKVREVFDCYAQLVYNAVAAIGQLNGLVEKCVGDYDFCPTCVGAMGPLAGVAANSTVTGRCPFQMSWHLADDDLSRSEIKNPFKGINEQAPCLQINFIKKGAVLLT